MEKLGVGRCERERDGCRRTALTQADSGSTENIRPVVAEMRRAILPVCFDTCGRYLYAVPRSPMGRAVLFAARSAFFVGRENTEGFNREREMENMKNNLK